MGAEAKSYISHIKILGEFDLSISKNCVCVCVVCLNLWTASSSVACI